MDKQAVVYPGNGILLGAKVKLFTKPGKDRGRPYMHINQQKMLKEYMLYDFSYITLSKRENYGAHEKISGCQG